MDLVLWTTTDKKLQPFYSTGDSMPQCNFKIKNVITDDMPVTGLSLLVGSNEDIQNRSDSRTIIMNNTKKFLRWVFGRK